MHYRGSEGDPLLPTSREASREVMLAPLQPTGFQHPVNFFWLQPPGHPIDAAVEGEVLQNGEVIVEGELLTHIANARSHIGSAQIRCFPRQFDMSTGGRQ